MGIRDFFWRVSDFTKVASPKPFNVIASQDGKLYEVRDHKLGRLVTEKKHIRELDLIQPGFKFHLPKVPGELLHTTLAFFKHFVREQYDDEVMVQLFWDSVKEEYIIECPYQTVSKVSVHVEDYPILHDARYIQVMQIHSHNTMKAFFSSVDDEDEKAYMIYGVVGELDQDEPQMKLRVGCNGEFIDLPIDYIFDNPNLTNTTPFPYEWLERVSMTKERE